MTTMPPSSEPVSRSFAGRAARGVSDNSQAQAQHPDQSNPFSRFYNADGSLAGNYLPLCSELNDRNNQLDGSVCFASSPLSSAAIWFSMALGAATCERSWA